MMNKQTLLIYKLNYGTAIDKKDDRRRQLRGSDARAPRLSTV